MHIPTLKTGPQSFSTVLDDFSKLEKKVSMAQTWVKNLQGYLAGANTVVFTNSSVIRHDSKSVQIAFEVNKVDLVVFTISCNFSNEQISAILSDPLASLEAIQQVTHQRWLSTYGVRTLENWLVSDESVWKGDENHTIVWLNQQVKAWLKYWTGQTFKTTYRPWQQMESIRL